MSEGFIKLYRSILNWEWWNDDKTFRVFIFLLLNANWEDTRYRGHIISKGSLVCGRKKLAKSLGMSEQSVRTSLEHLKSTNEITIKPTNKFSIITIVNWEKFQGQAQQTNQQTNQQINQRLTTYKEYKEYKEEKKKANQFLNYANNNSSYDWDEINREVGIK